MIDLRSDTVTRPTDEMRRAMFEAEVGDDVFSGDPTVLRLQEKAAAMLGKEAALFVPSGTMGNEIAIKAHTKPGDAILVDDECHIVHYELGGPAMLSGVMTVMVQCRNGRMEPDEVKALIHPADDHAPGTSLLCIENTHNRAGGVISNPAQMKALADVAHEGGLKVHVDGARIFNAAVALGVPVTALVEHADSVMFCLSKGLSCPIGSLLVGTHEFITRSWRIRKLFGGGMRQVGIIASAGLVALDTMIDRLAEDHRRARALAEAITEIPGLSVELEKVQTNMVYVTTKIPAPELQYRLTTNNIQTIALDPHRLRLVTHKDINDEDIYKAIEVLRKVGSA
jgi:threonine aldolase